MRPIDSHLNQSIIDKYINRRLHPEDVRRVEEHLSRCERCQAVLAATAAAVAAGGELLRYAPLAA